jgi:carboxymethylenebutenolidase
MEVDGDEISVPITMTVPVQRSERRPGIVLFPEIFGINDFILSTARNLAQLGYTVATPDLYHRSNLAPIGHDNVRQAMKLALTITPESAAIDTDAALAMLAADPDTDPDRIAVMGYCVGGMLSYAGAARRQDRVKACLIFYASGLMGSSPHPAWRDDLLLELGPTNAPVRMFYGGQDDHISVDYVKAVDRQLERFGIDVRTTVYDEAGHGFCNSHLPTFNADAAQSAWHKSMEFLSKSLC